MAAGENVSSGGWRAGHDAGSFRNSPINDGAEDGISTTTSSGDGRDEELDGGSDGSPGVILVAFPLMAILVSLPISTRCFL